MKLNIRAAIQQATPLLREGLSKDADTTCPYNHVHYLSVCLGTLTVSANRVSQRYTCLPIVQ